MAVLRRGDYADPAVVLERRESGTCRGCRHFVEQRVFDVSYMACKKDQSKHWRDDWKSKKCGQYDTGKG
jgi:hypothetical protein